MKKIIAITSFDNSLPLKQAMDDVKQIIGSDVKINKIYFKDFESPEISLESLKQSVSQADIVLLDVRSDSRLGRELPLILKDFTKTVVVLVGSDNAVFSLTRMGKFKGNMMFNPLKDTALSWEKFAKIKNYIKFSKKLLGLFPVGILGDIRNWMLAQEYYAEGGRENIKNLLLMLLKNYCGVKDTGKVKKPKHMPSFGLYCPEGEIFTNLDSYRRKMGHEKQKPTVAIILTGGMHLHEAVPAAEGLYNCLKQDVNIIAFYSSVEDKLKALTTYCAEVDLIVNLQYFRLLGGPYGTDPEQIYCFLEEKGVPLIAALRSFETEIEKWEVKNSGLSPIETVLAVTLPELDGSIEPVFLGGIKTRQHDPVFGTVKEPYLILERAEKLSRRIKNWITLQKKPCPEKKLAVITYNYPPGEENLGGAGYLDSFKSMEVFLKKLKEKGYNIEMPDCGLKDLLLLSGFINSPSYSQSRGIKVDTAEYLNWFGTLPKDIQEEVVLHWGAAPGEIMVDKGSIIIPGAVLGNIFLGVQPARGLHEDFQKIYHDTELPPHHQYLAFYFYLLKKFGADAIIHFGMHGTLEFLKGKEVALSGGCYPDILIGDMPHFYYYWIGNTSEATIAKRRSYAVCISHASPPVTVSGLYDRYLLLEEFLNQYRTEKSENLLKNISDIASELNLKGSHDDLKKELFRLKNRLIPHGLHVMDKIYSENELADYLMSVMRFKRAGVEFLPEKVAVQEGLNWQEIKNTNLSEPVIEKCRSIVKTALRGEPTEGFSSYTVEYIKNLADSLNASNESNGILKGLEGRYIRPARGGDPIKDPDIYPSGRAMFAFDPRQIPTPSAQVRGGMAAEELLKSYKHKNGRYPKSVAIVLWGFETMKTGGDTIATILRLLGVRINHKENPWIKTLEIIPLSELGRPRIDVLINICGIFRDTFATHIDFLNRAVKLASEADETVDQNYIICNCTENSRKFPARIFGPAPSEYATSLPTLIETGVWENSKDLFRKYSQCMSYAYMFSKVENDEDSFHSALKNVDIVTQERDCVEYEMTDLDHYYEFMGGLSNAVEQLTGRKAELLVTDQTEELPDVEELSMVIERACRTRLLNPRWIDGMLQHDFHGAQKIKQRVEHLLGFSATTGMVKDWLYDSVTSSLVFDQSTRNRLNRNNPYALKRIAEILLETEKRGLWKTSPETCERLRDMLLEIEADVE